MASKELLLEFGELAKGELALALLLMAGKPLPELLEAADELLEKPCSDFAGAICGAAIDGNEDAVLEEAKMLLRFEYPEIYVLLMWMGEDIGDDWEETSNGNDPDVIPV